MFIQNLSLLIHIHTRYWRYLLLFQQLTPCLDNTETVLILNHPLEVPDILLLLFYHLLSLHYGQLVHEDKMQAKIETKPK